MITQAIIVNNHEHPTPMSGAFSISECLSEDEIMVIHNIEKASAHGGAQNEESTPVERGSGSPQEEAWVHL